MALRQGPTLMNNFESVLLTVIFLALLAGVYVLIYKAVALRNPFHNIQPTEEGCRGIPHPRCLRCHFVWNV